MNSLFIKSLLCYLLVLPFVQTAWAGSELFTPAGRLEQVTLDNSRFMSYKELEHSTNPTDVTWWHHLNTSNTAKVQSVACEQAYLAEVADPTSAFAKTLDLCSKYDLKLRPDPAPLLQQHRYYESSTKVVCASWASLMRHYYIIGLLNTKDTDKALQELKAFDDYIESNLVLTANTRDMLTITIAAFSAQLDATRAVSKAIAKQQPKGYAELAEKITALEAKLAPVYADKAYREALDKVYEAERLNKLRADSEKKAHEDNLKEAEAMRAQRYREINSQSTTNNESSSPAGNCTCTRQEQVWVPQYSGSGMIKSTRGHYNFKTVEYSCPCK